MNANIYQFLSLAMQLCTERGVQPYAQVPTRMHADGMPMCNWEVVATELMDLCHKVELLKTYGLFP